MPNKPGYFEKYYAENKGKVNAKRKIKYYADSGYRARVLKASQEYRDEHRDVDRVRMPRFQTPTVAEAGDGGDIVLFSVGAAAAYLDRSIQAMNHWERAGILPHTPYRDERGFRFYTMEMMAAVCQIVGNKRRLFPVDPDMHDRILKAWRDGGVPVKAQSMKTALASTVTGGKKNSRRPQAK